MKLLQTGELPLSTRLQALQCLAQLLQLPPNICQPTRCSLLKAAFSTIFSSFLEHEDSKEPVNNLIAYTTKVCLVVDSRICRKS